MFSNTYLNHKIKLNQAHRQLKNPRDKKDPNTLKKENNHKRAQSRVTESMNNSSQREVISQINRPEVNTATRIKRITKARGSQGMTPTGKTNPTKRTSLTKRMILTKRAESTEIRTLSSMGSSKAKGCWRLCQMGMDF